MRALLLYCAGADVQDIFMHLEDPGTTCKTAMDALNSHFEPRKNVVFERHVFRQAIQWTNEPLIKFVTRFCKLAFMCAFANKNTQIRDQFIDKCSFNCLSCRLLQEPNPSLEKVMKKAQTKELAECNQLLCNRKKCRLVL